MPGYFERWRNIADFEQIPKGWFDQASPLTLPVICEEGYYVLDKIVELQKKAEWNATGLNPENSHFSVIVPIHNEEKMLPPFLDALLLGDFPWSLGAHFVFITNGSTDKSKDIIQDFFNQRLEYIEQREIDFWEELGDPGLSREYLKGSLGNLKFLHLDTETAGKPNALNLGTAMARYNSHRVVINIDADVFPVPGTIRSIFTKASKAFSDGKEGEIVILSGRFLGRDVLIYMHCCLRFSRERGWFLL